MMSWIAPLLKVTFRQILPGAVAEPKPTKGRRRGGSVGCVRFVLPQHIEENRSKVESEAER